MSTEFAVIFDNGGGTTLQTNDFCHHYDRPEQAAEDVKVLLETGNTADWEGNEPECRMEYDYDAERNGGYRWHDSKKVQSIIKSGTLEYSEQFGYNSRHFYETLGVEIKE